MQPTAIGDAFDDAPATGDAFAGASPKPRAHRRTRGVNRTSDIVDNGVNPPTEPKAKAAEPEPAPAAAPASPARARIAASDLMADTAPADLEDLGGWYWIGLLPGAPRSCVHVAGIAFPQNVEIPFRGKTSPLDQERELADGDVLRLSATKVREIAAAVRARGIRFSHPENSEFEQRRVREGYRMRTGVVVKYTSQSDIEAARAEGRIIQVTTPRQGDTPLAKFVYVQLLHETNPRPRWAGQYDRPSPISEAGIELPGPDAPPIPADARLNLARAPGMVACVGVGDA